MKPDTLRTAHLSREEGRALLATKPKPNKYRNKPVVVDGIRFDSKREAAYYAELQLREKAGEIGNVEIQKRYAMTGPRGHLIATYVADFAFDDLVAMRHRCIDVKGFETREFKIKRRMMKALLNIDVEVVK